MFRQAFARTMLLALLFGLLLLASGCSTLGYAETCFNNVRR